MNDLEDINYIITFLDKLRNLKTIDDIKDIDTNKLKNIQKNIDSVLIKYNIIEAKSIFSKTLIKLTKNTQKGGSGHGHGNFIRSIRNLLVSNVNNTGIVGGSLLTFVEIIITYTFISLSIDTMLELSIRSSVNFSNIIRRNMITSVVIERLNSLFEKIDNNELVASQRIASFQSRVNQRLDQEFNLVASQRNPRENPRVNQQVNPVAMPIGNPIGNSEPIIIRDAQPILIDDTSVTTAIESTQELEDRTIECINNYLQRGNEEPRRHRLFNCIPLLRRNNNTVVQSELDEAMISINRITENIRQPAELIPIQQITDENNMIYIEQVETIPATEETIPATEETKTIFGLFSNYCLNVMDSINNFAVGQFINDQEGGNKRKKYNIKKQYNTKRKIKKRKIKTRCKRRYKRASL